MKLLNGNLNTTVTLLLSNKRNNDESTVNKSISVQINTIKSKHCVKVSSMTICLWVFGSHKMYVVETITAVVVVK